MDPKTILHVGDAVVVREDLKEKNYPEKNMHWSLFATAGMVGLRGRTVVIASVVYGWDIAEPDPDYDLPRRYTLKDTNGRSLCRGLLWCPTMFSGYAWESAEAPLPDFSDEDASAFVLSILGGE